MKRKKGIGEIDEEKEGKINGEEVNAGERKGKKLEGKGKRRERREQERK